MVLVSIPTKQDLLEQLEGGRPVRLGDVLEEWSNELHARRQLEELEISGDVRRLVVGSHVMYRLVED